MAATIRLMRFGKKNRPFYRIVVMEKRRKRESSYIEKLGYYNPMTEPITLEVNKERLEYWLTRGAELSKGIKKLWKKIKRELK